MPAVPFALLILTVIAAAGASLGLVVWTGLPISALALPVLLAAAWPGLRRWK